MITGEEAQILGTSVRIAGSAVVFSLPFAIGAAFALSRQWFPARSVISALVHLPLVLPPVLVGFLLLLVFGRRAPIGAWLESSFHIHLAFTAAGAALATAVMTFPLMVRALRLSFEATDPRLLEAAAVLRASPWDRFLTVALPLAAPGVLAAAVIAFSAGLGEFGAVITFASNIPGETQSLPLAIYAAMQMPSGEGLAWRLAAYSFSLAIVGLIAAEALQRWMQRRFDA
ncbi:MAG: molybdate ABC transporter permease subunit [Proteobacteria bacterium]|nr:molybdate ABC transporter permease subunit [Pseudomonadota bacterium]